MIVADALVPTKGVVATGQDQGTIPKESPVRAAEAMSHENPLVTIPQLVEIAAKVENKSSKEMIMLLQKNDYAVKNEERKVQSYFNYLNFFLSITPFFNFIIIITTYNIKSNLMVEMKI